MLSLHGWTGSYPAYVLVGQNCPNMLDLHPIQSQYTPTFIGRNTNCKQRLILRGAISFRTIHAHLCFLGKLTVPQLGTSHMLPLVTVGVQFSAELPKPLVVQIAAPWTRTLSGVVGEARTKIHTQLPQGCGGFGVDPQRQNMLENSENTIKIQDPLSCILPT